MADDRKKSFGYFTLYLSVCLVIDLFPRKGPPTFRYTGVDPAAEVANLGWPLPLFIWDPAVGLQVGPMAYPVIGLQVGSLALALIAGLLLRRARQRGPSPTEEATESATPPGS